MKMIIIVICMIMILALSTSIMTNMGKHDNNTKVCRIRRHALIVIVAIVLVAMLILVNFMVRDDPSNINHIPINISYYEGPLSVLSKGSDNLDLQGTFKFITPETPEGFNIVEKKKEALHLWIVYENPSREPIIYEQSFIGEGCIDISLPKGGNTEVKEETLNGRNAVLLNDGDQGYIIFEDGINMFCIKGFCDLDVLYDMAEKIITKQ